MRSRRYSTLLDHKNSFQVLKEETKLDASKKEKRDTETKDRLKSRGNIAVKSYWELLIYYQVEVKYIAI